MKKFHILILVAAIVTFVTNCKKADDSVTTDAQLASQLVSGATDTLRSGGVKYILEANLIRYFSQGSASNLSPLSGTVSLVRLDSATFGTVFNISKIYVIRDNQIWTVTPSDASSDVVYKLKKNCSAGPEWGPNILVNVVAEVTGSSQGSPNTIIARDQNIYALY